MLDFISQPWPWYVAGPLIGLIVPLLLVLSGKPFGVSSSLRHVCAATFPAGFSYFKYDWKRQGTWSLLFVTGILLGGVVASTLLANPEPIAISGATVQDLQALGIRDFNGLVPEDLFTWGSLLTLRGFVVIVIGGFLVGFGARYAGGCTSGHAILGLATFQKSSLIATIGFFIGGLISTFLLYPLLF